jgi:hypothetical protein
MSQHDAGHGKPPSQGGDTGSNPVGTTRGNASSEGSSPPWPRCRHGYSGHVKALVKHADQAGPLVSRPAFVPQTTSQRHSDGTRIEPSGGAKEAPLAPFAGRVRPTCSSRGHD